MWQFVTPARNGIKARDVSTSRSRLYRPHCKPLEERCLLSVTLSGSEPPVPLVGSPVTWTAMSSGHGATPVYRYSIGPVGGVAHMVRDFSPNPSFVWNPMQEGNYQVVVTVKDSFSASAGEVATALYTAESRIVGTGAVISPTSNPLVALYSAPPSTGSSMYVQFKPLNSNQSWTSTSPLPIVPGESTNILVAGMLPNTTYLMRHVLNNGTTSAPSTFLTGGLPTDVTFPTFSVQQPSPSSNDLGQDLVFHIGINPPAGTADTVATDRQGNIVWYYDPVANFFPGYAPSLVPGGTVLMLGGTQDGVGGANMLREVDLAGDTLRETNIYAVNAELAALGQHSITDFNHDAQRLPNGDTAVLATTPRTVNYHGTPTLYNGDMVIVLDQNFQVAWVWDPFANLDTNRLPTLGEGPGDWMHANSVAWSPEDGNLLVSMRSQDQVVKIDYANGTGDGHVIWTLGQGGDFTINSSDPSPWFSHQHDVRYVDNNTLVVFDDGNTRQSTDPQAHSRGQELVLNEQTMQATLVVNADLGSYASALGSAQLLPNGNLDFGSGFAAQTIEVLPNGTTTYVQTMNGVKFEYRSYIYSSLYGTSASLLSPGSVDLSSAFNRTGIVADGASFVGGLDLGGAALSSNQVGTRLVDGRANFSLGPAGVPNVVSAAGQVIALPAGRYNSLKLLATAVNGAQRGQLFRVTYSDGTKARFRRSLSDWTSPKGFAGESKALITPYRNVSTGGQQVGGFHGYVYTLTLNPRKQVRSLTLPANANVEVIAATLIPVGSSGSSNPHARRQEILQRQAQLRQDRLAHQAPVQATRQAHPVVASHHDLSSTPSAALASRFRNRHRGG